MFKVSYKLGCTIISDDAEVEKCLIADRSHPAEHTLQEEQSQIVEVIHTVEHEPPASPSVSTTSQDSTLSAGELNIMKSVTTYGVFHR